MLFLFLQLQVRFDGFQPCYRLILATFEHFQAVQIFFNPFKPCINFLLKGSKTLVCFCNLFIGLKKHCIRFTNNAD